MYLIDSKEKKSITMTKIEVTDEETKRDIKNFMKYNVFQPVFNIVVNNNLTEADFMKMVIIHMMNGNRSSRLVPKYENPKLTTITNSTDNNKSTTKFVVKYDHVNRFINIYISDHKSAIGTRDIVIKAEVSRPNGGFFNEDLKCTFSIDSIDGLEGTYKTIPHILDRLVGLVNMYTTINETQKEYEFKEKVYNVVVSESTKYSAIRNIDNEYNHREHTCSIIPENVAVNLIFDDRKLTITFTDIIKKVTVSEDYLDDKLTTKTIRSTIELLYQKFIKQGGSL